jgi:hypothetical protein
VVIKPVHEAPSTVVRMAGKTRDIPRLIMVVVIKVVGVARVALPHMAQPHLTVADKEDGAEVDDERPARFLK